jgi:hypothetical protein
MKVVALISRRFFLKSAVAFLAAIPFASAAHAAEQNAPVNAFGAPVRDASGALINYKAADFARMQEAQTSAGTGGEASKSETTQAQGFVPSSASPARPFWQYAIFGSGIGASNIVTLPAAPGAPRQIIVGGNAGNSFGADNFWQIIQRNPINGNYDQIFVSPLYSAAVRRIAVGNVRDDSQAEIVVMLDDGRIYLYDLATRAELGYIATGRTGLLALSLTDLNGDGLAELLVTTSSDLFVFDNTGTVLWQVTGAGGTDIVAGQMDTDPALEIATTKGTVVDCATHAIQWTRNGGFGAHVKLAPLPGSSYQQVIAADAWSTVYSYDVATQLPRWSIGTPQDIAAIEVADVDNDGVPEILIGDGQWGAIRVHDLVTQAKKWQANNPEHGITNIAVDDVDNDGVVDLLWGAGWTSSGSDYLYVANTTGTHNIKWQSVDLQGPFLGPLIGDLDGDGKPELVICSKTSESAYYGPRLVVFDAQTLALRAVSSPSFITQIGAASDLKVRDLEGDGRAEIIVANSMSYSGGINAISFDSSNTFTKKWSSPPGNFASSSYSFVEVADLDGNGTSEIITGNGDYVHIFDYPSTAAPWQSVKMAGQSMLGLVAADLDGNGSKEVAALVATGDLYTFDGPTRVLKSLKQQTGAKLIVDRRSPAGLIVADSNGNGHFWSYSSNTYTEDSVRQFGSGGLAGLNVLPDNSLWIGTGGLLKLRMPPEYRGVWWQSPVFGTGFGRYVAVDQNYVFSSAQHAAAGYEFAATTPPPESVLGNISTRLKVETGDNILIGGFIVGGGEPKKVAVRAIGPSLSAIGVTNPLENPTLELRGPTGLIASNDDWITSQDKQAIIDSGVAPTNDLESAIIATLPANNTGYTAIVRGVNNGVGTGVVEIYDLNPNAEARMANISTRGKVQTGDTVLIAGTIVIGPNPRTVIVRALGPSVPVTGRLSDPTLELRNGNGALVDANDNWQASANKQAIIDTGIPPTFAAESAIVTTLSGNNASYTAIVRGVNGSTGIGVVEIYALEQ